MSSRSRSVAAERQGSQQGPLSGTSQPARFNPQVQSALPRPSRMAISQGGNARNRVQPSGIAGAAAGIAPASNVQVPAPTNKISRQKGSQSLRGEQPSGRYSSSQIQRNLQQKGNVPYPTALVPNVSATGEPVRKQAQSTSKKSQSARKTAPMPRQVSQPTQPAPVINQQGTQPSQQAVPERKQAQPQRQQPQESRKAPSQQAVPERKQAQPQRQQPQERKQAQPERKQQQKQSAPAPAKTEAKAPSGGKSKPDKNAKKNGDEKKSE